MSVAIYVRVSTQRQAQTQTIEQQLTQLRAYCQAQGWSWCEEHIFRDDGYSGASLRRPGLDRLRDHISTAAFDRVLITEPSRLARKYVHQMLLIEEFERGGCQVEFIDQPMSNTPHDQLLVQIRGAVAEYERSVIAERMRRGRLQKYQAGSLLPWTHPPYGYRVDPARPRDPAGVRLEPTEAAVVGEIFASYLREGQSLIGVTKHLVAQGVRSPSGRWRWNQATVRAIVANPVTSPHVPTLVRGLWEAPRSTRPIPAGLHLLEPALPRHECPKRSQVPCLLAAHCVVAKGSFGRRPAGPESNVLCERAEQAPQADGSPGLPRIGHNPEHT